VESRVKATFSSIANRYDIANSVISCGLHKLWKRNLVDHLPNYNPLKALDICCGTGDISFLLAKRYPHAQVVGVDFCEEMLELAEVRREKSSVVNVEFTKANALSLPFPENSFQVVTIAFGMRNIVDRERALKRVLKLLTKGGIFVSLEFTPPVVCIYPSLYRFYLGKVVPFLGGLITGDKMAYHYLVSSIEEFYKPEEFLQLMRKVGFKKVNYTLLNGGVVAIHQGFKE
jgi:demethylmenaquinone methyltransferase/2-methoxy-6-polyprenyl-1,4-benzoquinol methylase